MRPFVHLCRNERPMPLLIVTALRQKLTNDLTVDNSVDAHQLMRFIRATTEGSSAREP